MARKYRLNQINQLSKKDIFVDANVLIYLFWPTGSKKSEEFEKNYATVFNILMKQNNKLYISFLVVSEIINVVSRLEHKKYNESNNCSINYKVFRDSQNGKDVLDDIYTIVKDDILTRFEVVDKEFNKEEIERFLVVEDIDINDKAILEVCKENNMILLTNDSDFKNSKIDLLTCNNKLLS